MLTVMHNNRAWHQEYMFVEYMAGVRGRGPERATIGKRLRDPYHRLREDGGGLRHGRRGTDYRSGEVAGGAKRGVASVKRGEPYMIDVITQPR